MEIWDEKSNSFLYEYLNNASPTGSESSGQQIWINYIRPYVDEVHLDDYGTAYGVINPQNEYKVVIEAHCDEISWFVNSINKNGYISVIRNGGSDQMIAPSMRVFLHGEKGPIKGVFGWPAIHTRKGKNKDLKPEITNLFIDVGATTKEEVLEMGIHVGTIATFIDELMELNNQFLCGRALDNKMGGFCIAQVAKMIKETKTKLPFALYIINSVQEEVGLRGAEMITHTIKPNVAIVTDVTHDTSTPLIANGEHPEIKCGEGPSLTYAPAIHKKLLDLIIKTAEEKEIPFQREASSRVTGTDTDAFAYSNGGVPAALISLPLKYMHTTVETAKKSDIEYLCLLIFETIKKIDYKHNFKYFDI
jgi:putative aminopeptidase FrvX